MVQQGVKPSSNFLGSEPEGAGGWRLVSFMTFVFAVFLASYFGLAFGYKSFVNGQIEDLDKEIADLAAQVPKEAQDEFLKFQFQLTNLKKLLNNHAVISRGIALVEANTHTQVFYSNADFDLKNGKITLRGTAASYEVLAQQLSAIQKMPEVSAFDIGTIQLVEGNRINFSVNLKINKNVFRAFQPLAQP